MSLILLKEPTARKRIPCDRQNAAALGLDFFFDSTLVDEMHDDTNGQTDEYGNDEKFRRIIHSEIYFHPAGILWQLRVNDA